MNNVYYNNIFYLWIIADIQPDVKLCILCTSKINMTDPMAFKDIFQDFSVRSFTQLSYLIADLLQKSHDKVEFKVIFSIYSSSV